MSNTQDNADALALTFAHEVKSASAQPKAYTPPAAMPSGTSADCRLRHDAHTLTVSATNQLESGPVATLVVMVVIPSVTVNLRLQ